MLVLRGHDAHCTVNSMAFAPDGTALVSSCIDGTIRLWDMPYGNSRIFAQTPYPKSVVFTPDGKQLACSHHGGVTLWETAPGSFRVILNTGWETKLCIALDNWLLVAASFREFVLWDFHTGRALPPRQGDPTGAHSLSFSPDGRTLASSHWLQHRGSAGEHWIRLAETGTGRELKILRGHGHIANSLAFSPDGATLAAACGQFLWAWDVRNGEPVTRLKINSLHFQSVAFTPDGRFLAAARNDRTVRFWDARSWQQAAAFDWNIGPLVSLAIAPDGMRAAAGSKRGKIVVWDVDL